MAQGSKGQARRPTSRRRKGREAETGRAKAKTPSQTRRRKPRRTGAPDDPAVAAILETKPTTPDECIHAAKTLADLNRADLAKGFIKKVLDAKLDSQQLADLGEKVGSPLFSTWPIAPRCCPRPSNSPTPWPPPSTARLKDTKRIAALIAQLQDPSPEKRLQAVVGLQESQEAAIGPLVAVLADPARAAEHANVRAALVEIGRTPTRRWSRSSNKPIPRSPSRRFKPSAR